MGSLTKITEDEILSFFFLNREIYGFFRCVCCCDTVNLPAFANSFSALDTVILFLSLVKRFWLLV